jgi:hypothetical protein
MLCMTEYALVLLRSLFNDEFFSKATSSWHTQHALRHYGCPFSNLGAFATEDTEFTERVVSHHRPDALALILWPSSRTVVPPIGRSSFLCALCDLCGKLSNRSAQVGETDELILGEETDCSATD